MESEIEITSTDTKGWFEKTKSWSYENWQTILVILIVLIVGVSAYNYNQQNNDDLNPAVIVDDSESDNNEFDDETNEDSQESKIEETSSEIEETSTEVIEESKDQEEAEKEDNKVILNEETDKKEIEEGFSSLDDSGKTYTITASTGEGITHLARRALKMYTEETSDESALTEEQKVYAEDYIQNRVGNEKIDTGHQETFSESLIKDAISNANDLSEESLKNLTKYVK